MRKEGTTKTTRQEPKQHLKQESNRIKRRQKWHHGQPRIRGSLMGKGQREGRQTKFEFHHRLELVAQTMKIGTVGRRFPLQAMQTALHPRTKVTIRRNGWIQALEASDNQPPKKICKEGAIHRVMKWRTRQESYKEALARRAGYEGNNKGAMSLPLILTNLAMW
jgi:hypothetical protein